MESLFKIDEIKNCIGETVFIYYLSKPITNLIQKYVLSFGELKYPLKGTGFIRLESKDILLTGNVGSKELRLTLKYKSENPIQVKSEFDNILIKYLNDTFTENLNSLDYFNV